MDGPSGVLALVLAETAAGSTALLWLGRLWGTVRRGFFVLTGSVALVCALLATLAASGSGHRFGVREAVLVAAVTAALLGLSVAALVVRLDGAGHVLGLLSVPPALAMLVAFARLAGPALPTAVTLLLAGAAFMGAVTTGLLLGHWYLVDRRLSRGPINRLAAVLLAAVVVQGLAVSLLGFREVDPAAGFSPYLGIAGLSTWLALGMVACTALIAVLILATLKSPRPRAVQAATGFFYLAVITAFTAELAAKIGFFG